MFEQLSQLAEQAATNVSRRQFLGAAGRAAMAATVMAASLLSFPMVAQAAGGGCEPGWHRCRGRCNRICCPDGHYCCMRSDRGDRQPYCSCC
jgi:hypothetical protein